jgi:outer membrane protein assembly factor BamB
MKTLSDGIADSSPAPSRWYRSAVATAIVSAIFSVIICVFIVLNYGRSKIVGTARETELENLRLEIRERPDNEQLLSQIRQLDLQVRQGRLRGLDRSGKGSYLLLGSLAVLLASLKCAHAFGSKKMPSPRPLGDRLQEQVRNAAFSRWAVIAALVLLGSGALLVVIRPWTDFSQADAGGTAWPSMEQVNQNWPGFRGPGGLGISAHTNVPTNWDGKTGKGILWKTKVPRPGNGSPVVWGDRVFLSGGDPNGLHVFCFDAVSGKHLWTGDVASAALKNEEEPFEATEDAGFASPTVATDGRRVYALFATGDLGCFDFDGRKVWQKDLGIPDSAYGYSSSLAMYRNLLLVQYDQGAAEDEKSELIALDGLSGTIVWRTKRPVGNSWSSPIVPGVGDRHQVITCGDPWVIGYDPATGAELWRADCLGYDVAPSPIYANGLVFAIESSTELIAIRPDGRGDVTETHIAWINDEGGPDICSPVSNGELIFMLTTDGLLSCHQVSDGTKLWEHDLREYFMASPSLVGSSVYLLSEKGVMFIVEAGPEYKELAKCELGEGCHASPAFGDGRIYIRGVENLYCIGNAD